MYTNVHIAQFSAADWAPPRRT